MTCRGASPRRSRARSPRADSAPDPGAAGGAAGRAARSRPAGLGADRVGQDRGLRAGARAAARGRRARGRAAGAGGRRRRASWRCRCGPSSPGSSGPARGSGRAPAAATPAPSGRRWRRASTSWWARRGGCATTSGAGRSQRRMWPRGARRGGRDAGARLPRRARGDPGGAARGAADADVLGHGDRRRSRRWRGGSSAARCASTSGRGAAVAYQAVAVAPGDREAAIVNLLRLHEARGAIVFCGRREAVGQLAGRLARAGSRWWRCRAR